MDKQNYTLRGFEAQAAEKIFLGMKQKLKEDVEKKVLKRKKVLKSLDFLIKAISLYFVDQLSFQRLSDVMACRYGIVMSDAAWRKQFLKAAPILLEWTQQQQRSEELKPVHEGLSGPAPVYAIDATDLPAQGENTTSMRIHMQFSLTEHCCTHVEITDRHGAERLSRFPLRKGALYFADRAYGKASQLAYALEQQAHMVIRVSTNQIKFFKDPDCKDALSFQNLMRGSSFSTVAYFKYNKSIYYVRLLGEKIPEDKQPDAEKRVRRKASRNMRTVSAQALEASKWMILAASLSDSCPAADILRAYSLRWQIELHFKRVKSCLNFHKLRRSCPAYKVGIVSLWLVISFLAASLQLYFLHLSQFSISDFNAFSLARAFCS